MQRDGHLTLGIHLDTRLQPLLARPVEAEETHPLVFEAVIYFLRAERREHHVRFVVLVLSLLDILAHLATEGHLTLEGIRVVQRSRADSVGEKVEIEFVAPAFQVHRTRNLYTRAVSVADSFVLVAVLAHADFDRTALAVLTLDCDTERERQKLLVFLACACRSVAADNAAHCYITFYHNSFVF